MTLSYTPENENRLLLKLFWPVFIEQGLTILIGMVSTIMVSNVGDFAVSGVNLVDQINFMVISVFNALAAGATVVVAQYIGAGKAGDAGKTATQSTVLCVLLASSLGVISMLMASPILHFLYGTADKKVLDAGYIYMMFSGVSYPFLGIYTASAGIMRAAGNTRSPMVSSVIANIVNISTASILIFGAHLGVVGVSIAMLLARITSGLLTYMAAKKNTPGVIFAKMSLKFDWSVLKPVLNVGIPSGIDAVIFQGARIFMTVLMSDMGTSAMHANAIGNSLASFLNLPGSAFQIVSVTMVGQAYGARLFKSAKKLMFKMCNYTTVSQLLLFIPFFFLMNPLIMLYGPAPETLVTAKKLIYSFCVLIPFSWAFSFVLPQALRAVGDAKSTMYISVTSLFCLRIAGSWFFGRYLGWGVFGVWMGMYLDWFGRAAGFLFRASLNMWNGRKAPVDESLISVPVLQEEMS
jgi:putative MATE family efflux protein